MTKSELFKAAHKIAREIRSYCSDYRTAFSCALRAIYEGYTMEEKTTAQKLEELGIKATAQKLEELGIEVWENKNMRRYYIPRWKMYDVFRLDVDYYKSGNISSACLNGEGISNSKARGFLSMKIYYDAVSDKWMQRVGSNAPCSLDEKLFNALQI
jgi:hypothetical protein